MGLIRDLLFGGFRERYPGHSTKPSRQQTGGSASSSPTDLIAARSALKAAIGDSRDLVTRVVQPLSGGPDLMVAYLSGLVDTNLVHRSVLDPLLTASTGISISALAAQYPVGSTRTARLHMPTLVRELLAGSALLLADGAQQALILSLGDAQQRQVGDAITEPVIRGPHEGFTESLKVNVALVRRRLQDPGLRLESIFVGRRTRTEVVLCYVEDITNPHLVREMRKRLRAIDLDGILESGYLEQMIEDNHLTPFPQIQNTERPDRVVANLLEGRIAILVDGTPFARLAPALFSHFYQAPEDYYDRFVIGTLIRFIRILAVLISLFLPGLYVALVNFHANILPTKYAIPVAGSHVGVPFPTLVETLGMEIAMEVLREAGLRLPRVIGQTVSIVGALIIGQAAVNAGIVSPVTVIVVAFSTVGTFAIPSYSAAVAVRLLKFPLVLAAGFLGLFGLTWMTMGILIHAASLKSVGIPYLTPYAPLRGTGLMDTILRAPIWSLGKRPAMLRPVDRTRMPHRATLLGDENIGADGKDPKHAPKP